MIPSVPDCLELFEHYGMLGNIRDHSAVVANITALIVDGINREDRALSMQLAVSAALLHDIGKTACLNTDVDHAKFGEKICIQHGYEEVAGIVGDHVRLNNCSLPAITENEVVFYADKRVNHDSVVSLAERERYIIKTYGKKIPQRIAAIKANCLRWREVEKQIFSFLDFHPDDLVDVLGAGSLNLDMSWGTGKMSSLFAKVAVSGL